MPETELLENPAVSALIEQGASDGQISFLQINELLAELELDEEAVEVLLEALEKRAVKVIDEAPPENAPNPEKSEKKPKEKPKTGDSHSDLDDLLAELDEMIPVDAADIASLAEQTGDEVDDALAPVDDAFKIYLNRMGKVARLSREEEDELARVAQNGSPDEQRDARAQLVESNLRLVVHLASRAAPHTTLAIGDLLQEGNLGLIDAAERYSPDSGKAFGSYATWWIRRSLNRAMKEHARSTKLSGALYNAIEKIGRATRELSQTLGRAPLREELAKATGLSVLQIEEAQRAAARPLSLEAQTGGGDDTSEFGETLVDPASEAVTEVTTRREMREGLAKVMADLDAREKLLVQMRFGMGDWAESGPQTLEDVARILDLTTAKARNLETRALKKLRKSAKGTGLGDMFGGDS